MLNMEKTYVLTQDNDGHWYVVPYENLCEFNNWLELDPDDPDSWEAPSVCERVGGSPILVRFRNYTIDG